MNKLLRIYHHLLDTYGAQSWWPGESPFEVIVGAILTQSVAWSNAERAIAALRQSDLLTPEQLTQAPIETIASLIRPCLYYNQKARKLKAFLSFLEGRYSNNLSSLLCLNVPDLRQELLSVWGIGEETADAIILYAAKKPSFVADAYTRRILQRLGIIDEKATYADIRSLVMKSLPTDVSLYNEYHALLVRHGKERCRSHRPVCEGCPVSTLCTASDRVVP
jgi:endonuclease-3 related protein